MIKYPNPLRLEGRKGKWQMGRKGNWGARELLGRKGIGAQRELGRKGNWGAKEAKSFGQGCRTPLVGDSEVLFFLRPGWGGVRLLFTRRVATHGFELETCESKDGGLTIALREWRLRLVGQDTVQDTMI